MKRTLSTMFKTLSVLIPAIVIALTGSIPYNVSAQNDHNDPKGKGYKALTYDMVKAQLTFLSSDWMEGRETVSKGAFLAADYIASIFEMSGLAPAGDQSPAGLRSYFQRIPLIRTTPGDVQSFSITTNPGNTRTTNSYLYNIDYTLQNRDISKNISAPAVFIGYGLVDEDNGYDELKGVDVKNKIVVRLPGFPGHRDTTSVAYKKFKPPTSSRGAIPVRGYRDQRIAAANKILEEKGALAIITISTDNNAFTTSLTTNTNFYPNQRLTPASSGRLSIYSNNLNNAPLSITISQRLTYDILGSAIDLTGFEKQAERTMKPQSVLLQGKNIEIVSTVKSELLTGVNVCAMIEGKNKNQTVVIGAHYDHLGTNGAQIWNGTDDNASGTVAVMALGRAFIASGIKPECNIIFAAWTAEEKGLLGSRYFVEKFPDIDEVKLNINFDMIARDAADDVDKNRVEYTYTDSYPQWLESCKSNIEKYNIPIVLKDSPQDISFTTGTDFASFSVTGRPFVSWFTGFHPDYHQYTDDVSKVNWTKIFNIVRLSYLNAWDIINE